MEQARKERVRKPGGGWGTVDPVLKTPDRQAVKVGDLVRVPAEAAEVAVEKAAAETAVNNFRDQNT